MVGPRSGGRHSRGAQRPASERVGVAAGQRGPATAGADRAAPGDLSAPGLDGLIEVLARMLEPLGTGQGAVALGCAWV